MSDVGEAFVRIRPDTSGFADEAASAVSSAVGTIGDAIGAAGSGAVDAMGELGKAAGVAFAGAATVGLASNLSFEKIQTQFTGLLGSSDAAKSKLADLGSFVKSTPLTFGDAAQASKTLQIFGGAALNTDKSLRRLADASAVTGADLGSLATIYGRANANIAAGQGLGRMALQLQRIGVLTPESAKEIKKLGETSGTGAQQLDILNKGFDRFSGQAAAAAKDGEGLITRLKGAFAGFNRVGFAPLYEGLKGIGSAMLDVSNSSAFGLIKTDFAQLVGVAVEPLGKVRDALAHLADGVDGSGINRFFESAKNDIRDFESQLHGLTAPLIGVGAALGATFLSKLPVIGEFASAVNPVVGVIGGLVLATQQGRDAMERIGRTVLSVGREALPAIANAFRGAASAIGPLVSSISKLVEAALPRLVSIFTGSVLPIISSVVSVGFGALGHIINFVTGNIETFIPVLAGLGAAFAVLKIAQFVEQLKLWGAAVTAAKAAADSTGPSLTGLAFGPVGIAAAAAGIGIGLLTAHFADNAKKAKEAKDRANEYAESLKKTGSVATTAAEQFQKFLDKSKDNSDIKSLRDDLLKLPGSIGDIEGALAKPGGWKVFRNNLVDSLRDIEASNRGYGTYKNLIDQVNAAKAKPLEQRTDSDRAAIDQLELLNITIGQHVTALDGEVTAIRAGQAENEAEARSRREGVTSLQDQTDAVLRLMDAQDKQNQRQQDALDSQLAAAHAAQDLTKAFKENGASLDQNTEKGLANADQLNNFAKAAHKAADDALTADPTGGGASAALTAMATKLAEAGKAAGFTDDQIKAMIATAKLTPEDINIYIQQHGAEAAAQRAADLHGQLDKINDTTVVSKIQTLIDQKKIAEAQAAINFFNGLTAHATVDVTVVPSVTQTASAFAILGGSVVAAKLHADGGIASAFANGTEDHRAIIAPGGPGVRIWAEPETGGEAYIPLSPAKRPRSIKIWQETGHQLGLYEHGGIVGSFASGGIVSPAALAAFFQAIKAQQDAAALDPTLAAALAIQKAQADATNAALTKLAEGIAAKKQADEAEAKRKEEDRIRSVFTTIGNLIQDKVDSLSGQAKLDLLHQLESKTSPGSPEFEKWKSQIDAESKRMADEAKQLADKQQKLDEEIAKNRQADQLDSLHGQPKIDALVGLRDQQTPFTNEWEALNKQILTLQQEIAGNKQRDAVDTATGQTKIDLLQAIEDGLAPFTNEWESARKELEAAKKDVADANAKSNIGGGQKVFNLTLSGNFGPQTDLETQFRRMELLAGNVK